jgi:anaerobic glycerol-3-phosphate dehydrogenase
MSFFERLKEAASAEWRAYTEHPFTNGLADGSLAEAAFRHYLVQDYLFLIEFARAYALSVYKSPKLADMREGAAGLSAILDIEMNLHVKLCDCDRVRLTSRGGYNWTDRYPWIVEAARKVRQKRFILDGEAVVLGVDGISDFNALHSRLHDHEVQFCAFDILVEGGDDLRKLPLHLRKTNLQRLLARRPEGIFANPYERGEIGAPPAAWV